jgi:hypothetical protein
MSADQLEILNAFLNGVITMGHATAGLFFLRFWTKTRDRLFAMFALAFWILGALRIVIAFSGQPTEEHYVYWLRLIAYLAILAAIIDKNLKR